MMNCQRRGFACLSFLFLLISVTQVDGQLSLDTNAIDRAVKSEMERQELVGVAVAVIREGKIQYMQGYGFSDREARKSVSPRTVFNWASNSKPLIAVRAMQLVQQGKLDLDKPIGDYVPDLAGQLKPLTCRQLLCHQSGVPHYRNGKLVASPSLKSDVLAQKNPREAVRRFELSPLIFKPDAKTAYSSHAYVLLSAVLQAAGKEPIGEQLNKGIVGPLSMGSFQLDLPFDGQPNWTSGYRRRGGKIVKIKDYAHFWKHGAGGYKTNIEDFAKFAVGLMNKQLIDNSTTGKMWTRQKLSDGSLSNYGLGVQVSGSGKNLKVSHGGSQDETKTRMVIYPVQRHGVVVMCNTNHADPGKISTAIYNSQARR